LHLAVEEKSTNKPVGYVIFAGITNPNQNIKFRRFVISNSYVNSKKQIY
jgi:diamine N-acetyltransferase